MCSWGSAVLAHLYRELCRASLDDAIDIVGYMTLLRVLLIFFILDTHIDLNIYR